MTGKRTARLNRGGRRASIPTPDCDCPGDLSLCGRLVDGGVFARYLNVTTVLVSQWGRGDKRPQGASFMGDPPASRKDSAPRAKFKCLIISSGTRSHAERF